ncbi:PREDICTED: WD repeat-containing protein 3 [Fragaria vesca subsp. vesca]|uniref:WD repeat-containing protein 3 n=1 Tax=Fragaria vesca subsp. vesca TaxID=101020 RepID=UPI0002C330A1|nr:PREDICTED: WD repeat-containing protein 3 [Fragaria vesca subsp. vesca]XP_011465363.1 PREDICTED: WD repeat-containing protein 3 [Fragaria vesca subsp. vesca]XP_011465364.1 PREDICTED: WD repeat-containing protein 3 [Fragaria vesca subsp. vesca]
MGSYSEECEDQFYDTREDLSSVSDWGADCCEDCSPIALVFSRYECWSKNPESVHERRHRFLKWMGLDIDRNLSMTEESDDGFFVDRSRTGIDRMKEDSGVVLRSSGFEEGCCSNQCTLSSLSSEVRVSLGNALDENFEFPTRKLNDRRDFVVDELRGDGILRKFRGLRLNQLVSAGEIHSTRAPAPSPSIQQLLQREVENARYLLDAKKTAKRGWLKKLRIGMCVADKPGAALSPISLKAATRTGMQRVRVQSSKKRSKELSSLYGGQNFSAHKGSILSMKFSLDGQYLASAGQDGIVRVWKVIEDERIDRFDIANDPSSLYFKMNPFSKIGSQVVDKEKQSNAKKLGGSSDSACVIFPPKIFRLTEKPLHEFRGHSGDVLDLSWSKNGFLLSSSVDKTVRLWQVGCDRCLRVFSHNNYVTCVDFNPLDDNYFISGSIDGKVRIWEIIRCLVVDYIDVREIVTAVSYCPDGKGGIVGFVTGNCCFFNIIDDHLKLDAQICIQGKKKSVGKRITGFQFSPSNPRKVMVTSADSVIRVISGTKVICKFKGLRSGGSHVSASFTSDGNHIVSASEDSSVHIWNYNGQETSSSRSKNIRSCESFVSHNSMIAIPWNGVNDLPAMLPSPAFIGDSQGRSSLDSPLKLLNFDERVQQKMHLSSPDCFSLGRGFLLESLPKGTPTWPEEKLVNSSPVPPVPVSPTMSRSEYRFLKNACQSLSSSSHMWGLVIVTAGLDGRIRTYHNYGLPTRY